MSKVLQERGFGSLPGSTETNLGDHVKSISTTIEADMTSIRHIRSSQYAISAQQNSKMMFESRRTTIPFPSLLNDYYCDEKKGSYGPQFLEANSYEASHIDNSIPRKEKDPGSLGELAHTEFTVELADRTVKYPKGIAENVLVGIGFFSWNSSSSYGNNNGYCRAIYDGCNSEILLGPPSLLSTIISLEGTSSPKIIRSLKLSILSNGGGLRHSYDGGPRLWETAFGMVLARKHHEYCSVTWCLEVEAVAFRFSPVLVLFGSGGLPAIVP
ncbi:hypothetical protein Tco_0523031 [Tanacetum coccineum]